MEQIIVLSTQSGTNTQPGPSDALAGAVAVVLVVLTIHPDRVGSATILAYHGFVSSSSQSLKAVARLLYTSLAYRSMMAWACSIVA